MKLSICRFLTHTSWCCELNTSWLLLHQQSWVQAEYVVHVADGVWLVQLLVARRGNQGLASPLAGRLTAMRQQAEAAGSSKKEASTSGPAARVSTSLTPCFLPNAYSLTVHQLVMLCLQST